MKQEQKIETTDQDIKVLFRQSGLDMFVVPDMGLTRAGRPRLHIKGKIMEKSFVIDEHNGLNRIRQGDTDFLISTLGRALTLPGSFDATQLLRDYRFRRACITEAEINQDLENNAFMRELVGFSGGITVFYGSTAGINFAEVLETAKAAFQMSKFGLKVNVLFDYESIPNGESQIVFDRSMALLPTRLKEQVDNFIKRKRSLMSARLSATQDLLNRVTVPNVKFIDELEIFDRLADRFTIGQLLILARMAGNNPKVFATKNGRDFRAGDLLTKDLPEPFGFVDNVDLLKQPVAEVISRGLHPLGFTFYAREAVIGSFEGVVGLPLKLTDKANIYKILLSAGSLFNSQSGNGAILLPITRNKIQIGSGFADDRPIDPVVLKFLADDQPQVFVGMVDDLMRSFKVLSPQEAISTGIEARKFFCQRAFDLKEEV